MAKDRKYTYRPTCTFAEHPHLEMRPSDAVPAVARGIHPESPASAELGRAGRGLRSCAVVGEPGFTLCAARMFGVPAASSSPIATVAMSARIIVTRSSASLNHARSTRGHDLQRYLVGPLIGSDRPQVVERRLPSPCASRSRLDT